MARVHDRVSATQFTVDTWLDPGGIRDAGIRAMEAGRRFLNNTISEDRVIAGGISYVIRGMGNLVGQMTFTVTWSALDDGRFRVQLSVVDFLTVRVTSYFIPITPKSAPALVSLRRFADVLAQELAAGSVRPGLRGGLSRHSGDGEWAGGARRDRERARVLRRRRSLLVQQHS